VAHANRYGQPDADGRIAWSAKVPATLVEKGTLLRAWLYDKDAARFLELEAPARLR
jgi:hypothetical protein